MMAIRRQSFRAGQSAQRQRGVVLIIAIIVLLAMTLAAYAMLRSVGSSLGVAGNIAFKQNATSTADIGIEAARSWLTGAVVAATPSTLDADQPSEGYFSTWQAGFDPLTYNWTGANASKSALFPSGDASQDGNSVQYVIHRLCSTAGAMTVAGQRCVAPVSNCPTSAGAVKAPTTCSTQPYFRITARVAGPRNTVSYVQVVMY